MDTLKKKFQELAKRHRKAFIPYIPFGFPTLSLSRQIIKTLDSCGVDIIELGMPFSDPVADGPIIQKASVTALKRGVTLKLLLENVRQLQETVSTPIIILTYYNPVYRYGLTRFFADCAKSGVSGVMVVDLPIEEAKEYVTCARTHEIDTIFFVTPTTSTVRAKKIIKMSRGFIYYVSVAGITGPKALVMKPLLDYLSHIKKISHLPVCVGFGIHSRQQVRTITRKSDGVIVGSAVVDYIGRHYRQPDFLKKFSAYIKQFYV
jgi:tryptophan synthase alpha chain